MTRRRPKPVWRLTAFGPGPVTIQGRKVQSVGTRAAVSAIRVHASVRLAEFPSAVSPYGTASSKSIAPSGAPTKAKARGLSPSYKSRQHRGFRRSHKSTPPDRAQRQSILGFQLIKLIDTACSIRMDREKNRQKKSASIPKAPHQTNLTTISGGR